MSEVMKGAWGREVGEVLSCRRRRSQLWEEEEEEGKKTREQGDGLGELYYN